jgi:hypothetical protein
MKLWSLYVCYIFIKFLKLIIRSKLEYGQLFEQILVFSQKVYPQKLFFPVKAKNDPNACMKIYSNKGRFLEI